MRTMRAWPIRAAPTSDRALVREDLRAFIDLARRAS
jgi:hypothetical protein